MTEIVKGLYVPIPFARLFPLKVWLPRHKRQGMVGRWLKIDGKWSNDERKNGTEYRGDLGKKCRKRLLNRHELQEGAY